MTYGANNFNYFPDNQLSKFKLCPAPSNVLIFVPKDFCDAFCVAGGVPLDAPLKIQSKIDDSNSGLRSFTGDVNLHM